MDASKIDRERILRWFTGKAREKMAGVLDTLLESAAQGSWSEPRASIRLRSALGKPTVLVKLAKAMSKDVELEIDALLLGKGGGRSSLGQGWNLRHNMLYGLAAAQANAFEYWPANWDERASAEARSIVQQAKEWIADLLPVVELADRIDATRPQPVFTLIGASPTVTKTLEYLTGDAAPSLNFKSIRVCPIKWVEVERVDPKTGQVRYRWVGHLDPPADALWNCSRFADLHDCCHACGHHIRNPSNWVPILIDSFSRQRPMLLFVGTDCARTIFGVRMKGALELVRAPLP